jgi:uncharacterized membrane protein YpjA
MLPVGGVGMNLRGLFESDVPRDDLPRYVAPLPDPLENLALTLAWPIVLVNLIGTAFGFYYYGFQFARTPVEMWIFVPDSPVATLFIALALAAWKLGHPQEWLTALAFFGNIILGGWTVWVHLAFWAEFSYLHPAMRQFLIWSHAAMVLQAFVLHRISDFSPAAVGIATLWYAVDTTVDYFVPVRGKLHHTFLPVARDEPMFLGANALGVAAAGGVLLFVLALYLAMATRVEILRSQTV